MRTRVLIIVRIIICIEPRTGRCARQFTHCSDDGIFCRNNLLFLKSFATNIKLIFRLPGHLLARRCKPPKPRQERPHCKSRQAINFGNFTSHMSCHHHRNCITDLFVLLLGTAKKCVIPGEGLEKGGFSHRQVPVTTVVH